MAVTGNQSNDHGLTFLWVGSVIFKLHMDAWGTPLVLLGSFRNDSRPQGSWPMSRICRFEKSKALRGQFSRF